MIPPGRTGAIGGRGHLPSLFQGKPKRASVPFAGTLALDPGHFSKMRDMQRSPGSLSAAAGRKGVLESQVAERMCANADPGIGAVPLQKCYESDTKKCQKGSPQSKSTREFP